MSERTKLLKKAVLAGVAAPANVDRIKAAVTDAMQDLVKVGQDLFNDLEDKGKVKAETVQSFLRNLQDEASKRTVEAEKNLSDKVGGKTRKVVKELGLATKEDYDELLERIASLEEALHGNSDDNSEGHENRKSRRKKSQSEA